MRFLFYMLGMVLLAHPVHAATITVESASLTEGTTSLHFVLDTEGEVVNALEGTLMFPEALTSIAILDGNSLVNFWVERPTLSKGSIRFAGITPGGFNGTGEVFSLTVASMVTMKAVFTLADGRAFLNDGEGTVRPLVLRGVESSEVAPSVKTIDITPPEAFSITRGSDPSLFEGREFVVFASQDKDSGISHYEMAEQEGFQRPAFMYGLLAWKNVESPAVVSDPTNVLYVKAIDRAGNSRVSVLSPLEGATYYSDLTLLAILILFFGMVYAWYVRRQ